MPDPASPGLVLSPTASVGRDVRFGANVVVHDGVVIGDQVTIQDGVILGKPPALHARSTAPRYDGAPLVIESGAAVCAQAIVFAGAHIGPGAVIGDQTFIRERRSARALWSDAGRASTTMCGSGLACACRPTST
jgi:UDP-2-acetamido-3-amino-2,3-dideoxy-glucuronate N-acetyltransferase